MTKSLIYVVLLAAGQSTRLGGDIAKPWRMLNGKTVLEHGLQRLAAHPRIAGGVIVTSQEGGADELAANYGWMHTTGGAERSDSVKAGLMALAGVAPDAVLIHDAARPFVSAKVLDALMAELDAGHRAIIPALAPADSLKTAKDHLVTGRVPRDNIYRIQTPQAFDYELISRLHHEADHAASTDDASLVEDAGEAVKMVAGDAMMDKITTSDDLLRAEIYARGSSMMEVRMATGYDVHKFSDAPGPIMLGGIAIDHDRGFEAHSDGDVVLHALTDAIYGTMADGDIGQHFPPSDDQWKDKDSAFFLAAAARQLSAMGGVITFADITIIAEEPKITPHRPAMRARIAQLLNLPMERVSVKATTSEGLGFTGRREGIAVQAAVTSQLPISSTEA